MGKLKEILNKFKDFIKKLSPRSKKIIIVSFIVLVIVLSFFFVYSSVTKYGLLYSDLDPTDSKYIHDQLVDMGMDVKIRGKSIYVLREKVDELRLTFSPELKGGSKGFELLDTSKGFGYTDEEFLIQKQRIVQGELERTIRSFSQVKDSRVHISPSKTSVFMTDKDPARASVYLKLNPGESLSKEQVKSIIHLVSSAWNNLPFENVEVMDARMNLLSLGVYDGNTDLNFAGTLDNQMNLERKFEYELENRILSIIEPIFGGDKIRVRVNAELDFDSKKTTEIIVDDQNVPISEHKLLEENGSLGGNGGSPIDNNMSNTIGESSRDTSKKEESTVNYELSKQESTIIYAPGEVKRITVSFVYDGNITEEIRNNVNSLISGVIGFNGERGDSISIVGMEFNGKREEIIQTNRRNMVPIIVSIVAIIVIFVLLRIFKRNKGEDNDEEDEVLSSVSDIKEKIQQSVEENMKNNGIEDTNPENKMLEDAIKNYAVTKPSQVVDIIKSWMMEDTR